MRQPSNCQEQTWDKAVLKWKTGFALASCVSVKHTVPEEQSLWGSVALTELNINFVAALCKQRLLLSFSAACFRNFIKNRSACLFKLHKLFLVKNMFQSLRYLSMELGIQMKNQDVLSFIKLFFKL